MVNFNTAATQFDNSGPNLIPENTIVKVVMTIRPGSAGEEGWMTQSKASPWQYISAEFTIVGGQYDKRKFWQNMMWFHPDQTEKNIKTMNITNAKLRAMVESSRGIMPSDESDNAKAARDIPWIEINGMSFVCKLGVEVSKDPQYDDKNQIKIVVTPDMGEYAQHMGGGMQPVGQAAAQVVQQAQQAMPQAAPQAAPAQQPNVPAWANG